MEAFVVCARSLYLWWMGSFFRGKTVTVFVESYFSRLKNVTLHRVFAKMARSYLRSYVLVSIYITGLDPDPSLFSVSETAIQYE